MRAPIKTGLLAFGMSGQVFHAPFIAAHPDFELYGALNRHINRVNDYYPEVKGFEDYSSMLADEQLDLIIINTPNYTHYEYAYLALKAGKHIIIEKPFTCNYKEAVALFNLADQVGKNIFVYQNRRFDSGFMAFKNMVETERIGPLVEVHFRFDRFRDFIGPKQFKEEQMPGAGLLFDLGPHLIDQAIALFGKPVQCIKTLGYQRKNTKVDDYFYIHLTFPEQLQVHLTASFLVPDVREAFVVHGHRGSFRKMHADVQESQLLKGMHPLDEKYGMENPKDAGVWTELQQNGGFLQHQVPAQKGNYMLFFQAVSDKLLRQVEFPIKKEEILWQMQILDSPQNQVLSF